MSQVEQKPIMARARRLSKMHCYLCARGRQITLELRVLVTVEGTARHEKTDYPKKAIAERKSPSRSILPDYMARAPALKAAPRILDADCQEYELSQVDVPEVRNLWPGRQ